MHWACEDKNEKLIILFIEYGADVNKTNRYGDTAFKKYIFSGDINDKIVKILKLIESNKNLNEKTVKLLIESEIILNERNKDGDTYSEWFWNNGYKEIIKSFYNAHEIIYNDNYSKDLKPYLITKNGSIINIYENEFIEPINNNNSYLQVNLENQLYLVHLLVANTFKLNEDKALIVRHIDNNILNNNVENLEWVKYELDLSETEYICNIEFSEIPDFLHNSELYQTCLESEDDFEILKKYYKNDLIINSIDDFFHILYTLRFWCIEKIPYEIYDYIFANKIIINIY